MKVLATRSLQGRWAISRFTLVTPLLFGMVGCSGVKFRPAAEIRLAILNVKIQRLDGEAALGPAREAMNLRLSTLRPGALAGDVEMHNLAVALKDEEVRQYAEAEKWYLREQEIVVQRHGVESIAAAAIADDLGSLYRAWGKDSVALANFEKAFTLRERLLGPGNKDTLDSLASLSHSLRVLGKLDRAEECARRALKGLSRTLGLEHSQSIWALNELANILKQQRRYKEAEELLREELALEIKIHGPRSADVAYVLDSLGTILRFQRQWEKSEQNYREALEIYEQVEPQPAKATAIVLDNLGSLHLDMGRYPAAEAWYLRANELRRKLLPGDQGGKSDGLHMLGDAQWYLGHYEDSVASLKQALALRRRVYGPQHPDTAASLSSLARSLVSADRTGEALECANEAVSILTGLKMDSPNSLAAAKLCRADVYLRLMRTQEAEEDLLAAEHSLHSNRSNSDILAMAWYHLARLYRDLDRYDDAEFFAEKAQRFWESTRGPSYPSLALTLEILAKIASQNNRPDEAEKYRLRRLDIYRRTKGPKHPDVALALLTLANHYRALGRDAQSDAALQEATSILDLTAPDVSGTSAQALTAAGRLFGDMGLLNRALPYYEKAVQVARALYQKDSHYPLHSSLLNLASTLKTTGDLSRSRLLMEEAVQLASSTLGEDHASTLTARENLALLLYSQGLKGDAIRIQRDVLARRIATVGESSSGVSTSRSNLAVLMEDSDPLAVEKLYRDALTYFHSELPGATGNIANISFNLAFNLVRQKRFAEALPFFQTAADFTVQFRQRNFAFATEAEQIKGSATVTTSAYLALSLATRNLPDSPEARWQAFNLVLSAKGSVLEAQLQRHQSAAERSTPAMRELSAKRQSLLGVLRKLEMTKVPAKDAQSHQQKINAMRAELTELAQTFARASAQLTSPPSDNASTGPGGIIATLGGHLHADEALVEFIKHPVLHLEARQDQMVSGGEQYTAFICRPGMPGHSPEVAMVQLGPADKLDAAVAAWRRSMATTLTAAPTFQTAYENASVELKRVLWEPVAQHLGSAQKIFIAPDSTLSFVSFSALPGTKSGKFLLDDLDIAYVGTGRDLLRSSSDSGGTAVVLGAPDFGNVAPLDKSHDSQAGNLPIFEALPHAAEEVKRVAEALQPQFGVEKLEGLQATEGALRAIVRPAILHLATHGFYAGDNDMNAILDQMATTRGVGGVMSVPAAAPVCTDSDGSTTHSPPSPLSELGIAASDWWRRMAVSGPMRRSGIALAGANFTVVDQHDFGDDDGLLTAEEVYNLDLRGTRLVTLSACDTGLGQTLGAEGVFGLRRAFQVAGAENLVLSLWRVEDAATSAIMTSMYTSLGRQYQPAAALNQAQREWVAAKRSAGEYPHPIFWAPFVSSGSLHSLDNAGR